MPLIVAPDTTNPSRINITGDGFSFDVDGLGTRINITGVGRTVSVTYANPRANIQWGAGGISSSSYIGSVSEWYQGHMPGETDHSLKNTTAMTAQYLSATPTFIRNIAFTSSYMITCYSNLVSGAIFRFPLNDPLSPDGIIIPAGVFLAQYIAYSDDVGYFFGRTATSVVVYKVDWIAETCTEMTEETGAWTPFGTMACRAVNGVNDVLVGVVELDTETQTLLGVMIFDLNIDSVINFEVVEPTSPYGTGLTLPIGVAQSGNSVAFVVSQVFSVDIEPGTTYCEVPKIVCNISTGVITKIDLPEYTYQEGTNNDFEVLAIELFAMDNENGIMYYASQVYDLETDATYYYMRSATGPTFSPPSEGTNYGINYTGFLDLRYGSQGTVHHYNDGKILSPDNTILCALPLDQVLNRQGALDDENQLFWTFDPDNDKIVGTAFGSGVSRDITVDFSGTTAPGAGTHGRKLFIFNGYAVGEATDGKLWFLYPTI